MLQKGIKRKLFILAVILLLTLFFFINFSVFVPRQEKILVSDEISNPIVEDTSITPVIPREKPTPPKETEIKRKDVIAYVINQLSNDVWLVNLDKGTTLAKIPVGRFPTHGYIDNHRLYVTNTHDDTVSVIDTISNKAIETIPTGGSPQGIVVKGNFLYVAEESDEDVGVIDKNTFEKVAKIPVKRPTFMAFNNARDRIYVSSPRAHAVAVINPDINTVTKMLDVGEFPEGFAFDSLELFLLVANTASKDVSIISLKRQKEIQRLKTGMTPKAVAITEDNNFAFVANMDSSTVSVVGIEQGKVLKDIDVDSPADILIKGNRAYVASYVGNTIVVIDTQNLKVIGGVATELGPVSIVVKEQS